MNQNNGVSPTNPMAFPERFEPTCHRSTVPTNSNPHVFLFQNITYIPRSRLGNLGDGRTEYTHLIPVTHVRFVNATI